MTDKLGLFSNRKTCFLVEQEGMSPCSTRRAFSLDRHFSLFNTCLLSAKDTCLFIQPEDRPSRQPEDRFSNYNKKTCIPIELEDMSSCQAKRYPLWLNKKTSLPV